MKIISTGYRIYPLLDTRIVFFFFRGGIWTRVSIYTYLENFHRLESPS